MMKNSQSRRSRRNKIMMIRKVLRFIQGLFLISGIFFASGIDTPTGDMSVLNIVATVTCVAVGFFVSWILGDVQR